MSTLPLHLLSLAMLRSASLVVPRQQRAEWWEEWRAEAWHVRQACTSNRITSWGAEREIASFCMGAFQDAWCLRSQLLPKRIPLATTTGSARQCLLLLAGLAVASFIVAMLLPAVRGEFHLSPYVDAEHLVLLRDAQYKVDSVPTITAGQFDLWTKRPQTLFDHLAFYQMRREQLRLGEAAEPIAYASPNLLQLLGLPIRFASTEEQGNGLPKLILSDELWRKSFDKDRHIAGRIVRVGDRHAVIAGVAPKNAWELPGQPVAWLLLPVGQLAPGAAGFALGHLKPGQISRGDRWYLSVHGPQGTAQDLLCVSLAERLHRPWKIVLLGILLACLSLPATTSIPLGDYRVTSKELPWSTRLRRWRFLTGKIVLLLTFVSFASLDFAHLVPFLNPVWRENLQLISSFVICLFGLRWVLRDQRQRCPLCLGKLTHPARVGEPSRNFLAWNGTELICAGGHGLLHIPEFATSWFRTQRWLYLDPSWESLFADPVLATGY